MLHQSLQAKTLCMASTGAVYAASVGVHLRKLLALFVSCSVFHSGRALGIGGCTVLV